MSGSTGVDTSIYQTIKGPSPEGQAPALNPLAVAQNFQNIQRTGLENNQMLQQQQAKLAIGRAAQNAVDPTTGQIDENKFIGNVSQDPASSYLAQDMLNAQAARKLQNSETSKNDLDNGIKLSDGMVSYLGTLYNDPNLTKPKAFDAVNAYLSMAPHVEQALPLAMNFVKNMPDQVEDSLGPDGKPKLDGLRSYIGRAQSAFANAAATFKMAHPDYDVTQGPLGATFYNKNKGVLPQNAPLDGVTVSKGVDPSVLAGQQEGPVVNNQPTKIGNPALLRAQGVQLQPGVLTKGPLGAMAAPQPAGGGIIPRAMPPNAAPIGAQGQASPPAPIAPPQGATPATPQNPAAPGPYVPHIPAASQGPADPLAAMTSGQPFATQPSEASKQQQQKTVENWQTQQTALTQKLSADHDITNAIGGMDEALKQFKPGAGGPVAIQLATALKGMARFIGEDTPLGKRFANNGDDLIANPNDPEAGKAALDAVQTFKSYALEAQIGKLRSSFSTGGTQDEFNALQQGYLSAANQPGSTASLHDFAKKIYAYDLAKAQAANTYKSAAEGKNGQGSADWNNFAPDFQQYALAHGFGSVTPSANASVPVPGDEQGLMTGVGLHPQALEHAVTSVQPRPSAPDGTISLRGGIPWQKQGKLWLPGKMVNGEWQPLGAQ